MSFYYIYLKNNKNSNLQQYLLYFFLIWAKIAHYIEELEGIYFGQSNNKPTSFECGNKILIDQTSSNPIWIYFFN